MAAASSPPVMDYLAEPHIMTHSSHEALNLWALFKPGKMEQVSQKERGWREGRKKKRGWVEVAVGVGVCIYQFE